MFWKNPVAIGIFARMQSFLFHFSKQRFYIPWAKWDCSYPSFGDCSMSSRWTSYYKTILLIPSVHKANPLSFTAYGLYSGFHSWKLKVPKLLQHGSESLRRSSVTISQQNIHFHHCKNYFQSVWLKGSSFSFGQTSCIHLSPLFGTCMNISVWGQSSCSTCNIHNLFSLYLLLVNLLKSQ